MSEGFSKRMAAIVGDENTVARYLTEKIGHTALIAWALVNVAGFCPYHAAVTAALLYVAVGKVLWWVAHHHFDWRDAIFDSAIGLFVAVLALPTIAPWYVAAGAVLGWFALIAAGSNNRWGSPS